MNKTRDSQPVRPTMVEAAEVVGGEGEVEALEQVEVEEVSWKYKNPKVD